MVSSATLVVLVVIAYDNLAYHERSIKLHSTAEIIWDRIGKPSMDETVLEYSRERMKLKRSLTMRGEVSILSRTCTRLWFDYHEIFEKILTRDGSIRLLFVDPDNGALRIIIKSAELDADGRTNYEVTQEINKKVSSMTGKEMNVLFQARPINMDNLANSISSVREEYNSKSIEARVIDYLPTPTLIIVKEEKEGALMFVELGTCQSNSINRPTFFLRGKDFKIVNCFQFSTMNTN